MADLSETRRRFMAYFASAGLGATLAPGIVWARMQDAGAETITIEMITEAMKLSGLEFTLDERNAMVEAANQTPSATARCARFTFQTTSRRRFISARSCQDSR